MRLATGCANTDAVTKPNSWLIAKLNKIPIRYSKISAGHSSYLSGKNIRLRGFKMTQVLVFNCKKWKTQTGSTYSRITIHYLSEWSLVAYCLMILSTRLKMCKNTKYFQVHKNSRMNTSLDGLPLTSLPAKPLLHNQFSIALDQELYPHDSKALMKCSEILSLLVRWVKWSLDINLPNKISHDCENSPCLPICACLHVYCVSHLFDGPGIINFVASFSSPFQMDSHDQDSLHLVTRPILYTSCEPLMSAVRGWLSRCFGQFCYLYLHCRDAAHITPYNFDSCVHTIRVFVEASMHNTIGRWSSCWIAPTHPPSHSPTLPL